MNLEELRKKQANKPAETPALKQTPKLNLAAFKKNLNTEGKPEPKPSTEVVKAEPATTHEGAMEKTEETKERTLMDGESPASAPVIEIPEGLEEQQQRFLDNFNRIPELMHDPDMLGSVLTDIMNELSAHPDYEDFMTPDCLETMMRGLTETLKVVKASKAKTSKATGSKKKKSTSATAKAADELAAQLNLGGEDGKLDLASIKNLVL